MALIRERVRHALAVRRVTVARVVDAAPAMRRVTLAGEQLDGFASLGPADHLKVFFPEPGTGRIVAPALAADGTLVPPSSGVPLARDFTPAQYRAGAAGETELDLDFFLHPDGGPAASWAARAGVGDELVVAGPRGSLLPPSGVERVVLVGDETALPAIRRWLMALPEGVAVTCLLTAADEGTRAYLDAAVVRGAAVAWFAPGQASELERALRALGPLPESAFVFLAGNAAAIAPLRRYLRRELGLPKEQVAASGYWRPGVVALDHHAPVDPSDPD